MGFLNKLFGPKGNGLSKIDYWKKWELFELLDDLHEAEKLLTSGQFDGDRVGDFKAKFIEELAEIEGANIVDLTRMWQWFSPNGEWDSKIGINGNELGKSIFRRTDRWKRNQEFIPGTKVSLKNEFGIVLDKSDDSDLVGLIRWDSEKEKDIEDWRGLFGVFLQAGGEIIDQDYSFRFIDDKGQLKKAGHQ
jgi:hypothetical protein